MNKFRAVAIVCLCLFCLTAVAGTMVPFYVQALGVTEEEASQIANDYTTVPDLKPETEVQTANTQEIEYVTETRVEDVAYGTDEIQVDTIPRGTREVVTPGVLGKVRRTYLVKYVNGVKCDEALYTEFPMSDPVNEVVNVGVGGTVTAKDGTVYTYNYRRQMEATAYTYLPPYTSMTTATGATLRKGIVAVDPREIPMHTKMFITSDYWEYGLGVAEDTGGAIKGNIIDLAYMSYDECIQFGRRQMQVYFID
ncbi:MAG: hypothetical protein E7600_06900 [Ruminococcaceae bacterium]|nr:hypothetical protein [Oscillospiraceae bacterium]